MSLEISITPVGGGDALALALSPGPIPIISNPFGVAGEKQNEALYDSVARFLAYRGNDNWSESFETMRNVDDTPTEFADGYAAAAWFRGHLISTPREGQITFDYGALVYTFLYATLDIRLARQRGKLLNITYTIIGQQLTLV